MLYIIILLIFILLMISRIQGFDQDKKMVFCLSILWILATFRSTSVGNDTSVYYDLFKRIASNGITQAHIWRYEYGYLFLNLLVSCFTDNFTVFLFIINSFIYFTYYRYIKQNSQDPVFSVILFMCLGFFGQTMNIIRLQLAISCCLWADMVKEEATKKRYYILIAAFILAACMFQRIALIYAVVFILPPKISARLNVMLFLAAVGVMVFFDRIIAIALKFFPYFSIYVDGTGSGTYRVGDIQIATIIIIMIQFLTYLFSHYTCKLNKRNKYDVSEATEKLLAYDTNKLLMAFLISLVSLQFNLLDRCANFFWISSIVSIPEMIYIYVYQNNNNHSVLRFGMIVFALAYFGVLTFYKTDWNMIYPYTSVIFGG